MSYLGRHHRDLLIPPRPARVSPAASSRVHPPMPRFTLPSPRLGPVQEASLAGIVALSACWMAAEVAFLLFG